MLVPMLYLNQDKGGTQNKYKRKIKINNKSA